MPTPKHREQQLSDVDATQVEIGDLGTRLYRIIDQIL
jgi:hypothetical protein